MRDRGIECPEEISVVGFGDEGWSELTLSLIHIYF